MDMALSGELSCLQTGLVKGETALPENILAFLVCNSSPVEAVGGKNEKICQSSSRALHLFLTLEFYRVRYKSHSYFIYFNPLKYSPLMDTHFSSLEIHSVKAEK